MEDERTNINRVIEPVNGIMDITGRIVVQLFVVTEDDDSDVDRTQDRELMCLLEEASLALQKCSIPSISISLST